MLKKLVILFLLPLYLVTSAGLALNFHYCGGVLASVKIDAPAKKCSPVKMKCCRDERLDIKVKDAHKAQFQPGLSKIFGLAQTAYLYFYNADAIKSINVLHAIYRGPPDINDVPVYLQHRVFLI